MKITLDQAYALLEKATAVVLPDNDMALVYPSTSQLTDEPDNEFLFLSWSDEKGYEFNVTCQQSNNEQVEWDGDCLIFKDDEGEDIQMRLLIPCKAMVDFQAFVSKMILDTTNDITEYLNHSTRPMECIPNDVDAKLNACRDSIKQVAF